MMKTVAGYKGAIAVAALGLALAGCETVSDYTDPINPFKKEEKTLPGERKNLFDQSGPVVSTTGKSAKIGAATGAQQWTQAGGNPQNNPGNLSVNISGVTAWRASLGNSSGGGLFSASVRTAARPVAGAGRVFAYKQNGEVVALSLSGGGRGWTKSLRPEGESDVGTGGGAAFDNNRLFVATAYRQLIALDAGSGKVLWTKELSAPARGAPTAAAGKVFVVTQTNEVYAVDQSDGTESWSYSGIPETAGILASANPAVSGDVVVVPFSSGEVMAIDIKNGEARWIDGVARSYRTLAVSGIADVSASPVISGGVVFATGVAGRTIAASLKTGERLWEQNIGSVHTPVASGDALFMIDLDDNMVAMDRKTGDALWSTALPNVADRKKRTNWAGPVLANGVLVAMSGDGRMARVDAATGRILGTKETSVDVYVNPIVAGGRMLVISGDGELIAFN